jgi:hypothetical protein
MSAFGQEQSLEPLDTNIRYMVMSGPSLNN